MGSAVFTDSVALSHLCSGDMHINPIQRQAWRHSAFDMAEQPQVYMPPASSPPTADVVYGGGGGAAAAAAAAIYQLKRSRISSITNRAIGTNDDSVGDEDMSGMESAPKRARYTESETSPISAVPSLMLVNPSLQPTSHIISNGTRKRHREDLPMTATDPWQADMDMGMGKRACHIMANTEPAAPPSSPASPVMGVDSLCSTTTLGNCEVDSGSTRLDVGLHPPPSLTSHLADTRMSCHVDVDAFAAMYQSVPRFIGYLPSCQHAVGGGQLVRWQKSPVLNNNSLSTSEAEEAQTPSRLVCQELQHNSDLLHTGFLTEYTLDQSTAMEL
ncbi:hypothetical protein BSLG_001706 [Batrachochytrium salamandrivorans]|nr:hypothetical protein BSLG_001706 [Batrachochytrium salamandrivorans]